MRKKNTLNEAQGAQTANVQLTAEKAAKANKPRDIPESQPMSVSFASTSETFDRRNVAGSIERTDRFVNIDRGLVPFRNQSTIYGSSQTALDVRDAVILCQKCYYNFALFRNIIDLMTEFSVSKVFLRGGSEKSRAFFKAFLKKINIEDLQDRFYREYWRSGNVFFYRIDMDIDESDIQRISQIFAAEIDVVVKKGNTNVVKKADTTDLDLVHQMGPTPVQMVDMAHPGELKIDKMVLPARYIILNPADIQMMSTLNFAYGMYFKVLNDYEVARLRYPKSEEDVAVFNNLPKDVQTRIKMGTRVVAIPLEQDRVSMVFYKKQDYEPFAVPMGYPVLEDINFKAELRKIDMAIARTMQQIILLVTCGAKPEEGGINQKNIEALKKLFQNQSVGRVLIADYTTKAEFVIPDIAELLDPKKYAQVDKDINIGLNNVFAGDEKFANQAQKVELFVARLECARRAFLNNFLLPEIIRISKSLGFKNFPTPYLEDIKLKDNTNLDKIYARLIEIGVLTPEQGFKALQDNVLPDPDQLETEQEKYKDQREKGLYQPLVGGGKGGDDAGHPGGANGPASGPKTVGPIGTGANASEIDTTKYSLTKLKDYMILAQQLEDVVTKNLKSMFSIKKLNKIQKEAVANITNVIIANEEPSKWLETAKAYCEKPEDKNHARVSEMNKIAVEHQLDDYLAGLLLASKKVE